MHFSTSPIHSLAQWAVMYVSYAICYLVPHLTHSLTGSVSSDVCVLYCMHFSTSPIHSLAQWAVMYVSYAICYLVPDPFTHWLFEQWCMWLWHLTPAVVLCGPAGKYSWTIIMIMNLNLYCSNWSHHLKAAYSEWCGTVLNMHLFRHVCGLYLPTFFHQLLFFAFIGFRAIHE